jgi:hypothetical protein
MLDPEISHRIFGEIQFEGIRRFLPVARFFTKIAQFNQDVSAISEPPNLPVFPPQSIAVGQPHIEEFERVRHIVSAGIARRSF